MNMNTFYQTVFLTGAIILLSACGQDYVAQKYFGTPYGTRTAGSGIEYVRANMAPKRGLVMDYGQDTSGVAPYTVIESYFKEFQTKPQSLKLETRGDRWFLQ
jgi:hypothetical protein